MKELKTMNVVERVKNSHSQGIFPSESNELFPKIVQAKGDFVVNGGYGLVGWSCLPSQGGRTICRLQRKHLSYHFALNLEMLDYLQDTIYIEDWSLIENAPSLQNSLYLTNWLSTSFFFYSSICILLNTYYQLNKSLQKKSFNASPWSRSTTWVSLCLG